MKKRALFIANGIVEDKLGVSGGEMRFIEVAKGWSKLGYEIDLLSNPNGKRICSNFGLEVTLHKNKPSGMRSRLNFVYKTIQSPLLPKTLKKYDGEIVYSTNEQLYDVLPALIIKILNPKVKWGGVVHWLPPWEWWIRKESKFFNSLLFLISERISLYTIGIFGDVILAVSQSTKNQIEKDIFGRFFKHKIRVVSCGVDLEFIKKELEKHKNISKKYDGVFMKRIQAVKGVFDLVPIWEGVVKKNPTAKLLIMGSGPDEELLKKLIIEHGLENNIEMAGSVLDMGEKYKKIMESKLFILPSYEENWAIVIGEALASNIPVVTYDLPELHMVWKDHVSYIDVGDISDFSIRINYLLSKYDTDYYKRLQKRGTDYMKQYSWDTISREDLSCILSPKKQYEGVL